MARIPVSLPELYETQERLITAVQTSLNDTERSFLLSIKRGEPDWDILGIDHFEKLPSLQWKLINIRKMDKKKHLQALQKLEKLLMK